MADRKSIDELIAAASLGTPGAVAVRQRAAPKTVEEIVARSEELYVSQPDDALEDEMDALDDQHLADLERELADFERAAPGYTPMTEQQAHAWWARARRAWGRLQQVRRGTRVRCVYGCRSGCPMCEFGFMDRDEAIRYLECDMEISLK